MSTIFEESWEVWVPFAGGSALWLVSEDEPSTSLPNWKAGQKLAPQISKDSSDLSKLDTPTDKTVEMFLYLEIIRQNIFIINELIMAEITKNKKVRFNKSYAIFYLRICYVQF